MIKGNRLVTSSSSSSTSSSSTSSSSSSTITTIMKVSIILLVWILLVVQVTSKKNVKHGSNVINNDNRRKKTLDDDSNDDSNNDSYIRSKSTKKKMKKTVTTNRRKVILPTPKQSISVSSISQALMKSAEVGLTLSNRIQRGLKTYLSSDFEALLLKLTSPDDNSNNDKDRETFLNTIDTFARNLDMKSESNPYRVTLRKIWAKICESDGRTVLKSFFLLHNILRSTEPEDSVIFKSLISKMSKERYAKSGSKYFDTNVVSLSSETKYLELFISRYSSYVLKRARAFTSSFEEVKLIGHNMRADDICASMMKACKVLDAALACFPQPNEECEVVIDILELLALDIRELFTIFYEKLKWIDREEEVGDLFSTWQEAEVSAILTHLKSFYNDRYDEVKKFLNELSLILKLYKRKLKTKLSTPPVFKSIRDDIPKSSTDSDKGQKDDADFDADSLPTVTSLQSDYGCITDENTELKNNNNNEDIFEDDNSNSNEIDDFKENKD